MSGRRLTIALAFAALGFGSLLAGCAVQPAESDEPIGVVESDVDQADPAALAHRTDPSADPGSPDDTQDPEPDPWHERATQDPEPDPWHPKAAAAAPTPTPGGTADK